MKIHAVDNSLKNLGKTVLWQYDRAVRLLAVLKHMQVLYHCAVEQFWDFWTTKVLSIDSCNALGCSIWGILLGVPRPTIIEDGNERLVVTAVYRRILKGTFYLQKIGSSFNDILGYLEILFGIGGKDALTKWKVDVSEYGWTTNIDELNDSYQSGIAYDEGNIVWYHAEGDAVGSNWRFTRNVSAIENTSWAAIADARIRTSMPTNVNSSNDTLLLKLFDPEGICRKIGGAPSNSLSISVEYSFGETVIKAIATRRRKCGVMLTDNGDMSITYSKSPYFEEMHKDQKYLFEQKQEEFCPYPLGIKTNEPVGNWVFGLKGQQSIMYSPNTAYSKGDIFGYIDDNNNGRNWECTLDISAEENTSFESISGKIQKTSLGGPFVGSMGEKGAYYIPVQYGIDALGIEPISDMIRPIADRTWSVTAGELFYAKENGILLVFKNTSNTRISLRGSDDPEYVNKEKRLEAFAQLARSLKLPVIPYDSLLTYMPNTVYHAGDVIKVNGTEVIMNQTGYYTSEEMVLRNSSPVERAGIHPYYATWSTHLERYYFI